jgi:hypothetical protein
MMLGDTDFRHKVSVSLLFNEIGPAKGITAAWLVLHEHFTPRVFYKPGCCVRARTSEPPPGENGI